MKIYSSISQNKLKTWVIMAFFVVMITTVVYVFSQSLGLGLSYVAIALIFSILMSVFSYFYSDKLVLATMNAKEIKKSDFPELFKTVQNLTIGAGLPMPRVYVSNEPSPNAFATGRDPKHAVVLVTTGLLEKLDDVELEGVIAHELSHVKNYDIRLMSIVAILVGFIVIISDIFTRSLWFGGSDRDSNGRGNAQAVLLLVGIIFAILSPIAATLIQLSISRKREFLADASGALLTRYPEGLASALEKISNDKTPMRRVSNATAHLFFASPYKEKSLSQRISSLFETHPPARERIKILRSM